MYRSVTTQRMPLGSVRSNDYHPKNLPNSTAVMAVRRTPFSIKKQKNPSHTWEGYRVGCGYDALAITLYG